MTRPKEILKFSANKFDEIDLDHYISNSLLGRFDFLDLVLLVWLGLFGSLYLVGLIWFNPNKENCG